MADLKKVLWDAGHGGKDPGAVGYVKEAAVNIKVVNYAHEHLKNNYECESKKDITADSIRTVVGRANSWGADLFVSVHFNAHNGKADGYEALVYSSKNKALGQCFEKHVKSVGQNSRGVKYRPDLGVLRLTNMKAILNEIAFVDNKKDIRDWDEDDELKVMGIALAEAAADYLDIPKKKKTATSTVSKKTSFKVRVKVTDLNIRESHSENSKSKGFIKPGVYTIVETYGTWGKLKSGEGWISLKYAEKI